MKIMLQKTQSLSLLIMAFLGLLYPVATQAASFDCAKASTEVEKMICADPELSKLDEELGKAYSEALKKVPNADALKQQQLEWMKERNACGDTDCVEMAYRSRIGELNSGQAEGRFLTVLAKNEQLCAEYKSYVEHEVAKREQPSRFFDSKPICEKHFGTDFPGFQSVQWREISPIEHPDLAVQAYRYIHYWPWNRKEVASSLADSAYKNQLSEIKLNHSNRWWRMWLGEADIGNTGHMETLLRVEEGRCGQPSMTGRPPRWSVPVMVVDEAGKGIDTDKSEWILRVTVPSPVSALYWPSNIKPIQGWHSLLLTSFDVFNFFEKTFFDKWDDESALPQSAKADPNFAILSVYEISQGKTTAVCRYKFKKKVE